MTIVAHLFLFGLALGGIWICAGHIVRSIERLAHSLHKSSFAMAFFVLGLLTSLTEISVAINSSRQGVPHLSAGNLVGGSLVIYLLVIPLLAIFGRGVALRYTLTRRTLVAALIVIALPCVVAMLGLITPLVGGLLIIAYSLLVWTIACQAPLKKLTKIQPQNPRGPSHLIQEILIIGAAGIGIFLISTLLVSEGVSMAHALGIPASAVGLVVLSVGTNAPELMIAMRAIAARRKSIAFGDYLGSAAANTLIFGVLLLVNGRFRLEPTEFFITAPLLILGLLLFYFFSRSRYDISRREGMILGLVYIAFLVAQFVTLPVA